jgi:hypothetical protein
MNVETMNGKPEKVAESEEKETKADIKRDWIDKDDVEQTQSNSQGEKLETSASQKQKKLDIIREAKMRQLNFMNGKGYLKRLQREYNTDTKTAQSIQKRRMERVLNIPIYLNNKQEYDKGVQTANANSGSLDTTGGYFTKTDKNDIPFEHYIKVLTTNESRNELVRTSIHELAHASTIGDFGMSKRARQILQDSIVSDEQLDKNLSEMFPTYTVQELKDMKSYAKQLTELSVRVNEMRMDMIEAGIVREDEDMTPELFKKINDIKKDKRLHFSTNVEFFLRVIKSDDYDTMKDIWDNIADFSFDDSNSKGFDSKKTEYMA